MKEYFNHKGDSEEKTISCFSTMYKELYWSHCEKEFWIRKEIGYLPADETVAIEFYYRAMHDYGMGLTDADDYAWLNTLFGYDIGAENALKIIRWYYEKHDATVQDMVTVKSKTELQNICENQIGVYLDYSKWPEEEPGCLKYFV